MNDAESCNTRLDEITKKNVFFSFCCRNRTINKMSYMLIHNVFKSMIPPIWLFYHHSSFFLFVFFVWLLLFLLIFCWLWAIQKALVDDESCLFFRCHQCYILLHFIHKCVTHNWSKYHNLKKKKKIFFFVKAQNDRKLDLHRHTKFKDNISVCNFFSVEQKQINKWEIKMLKFKNWFFCFALQSHVTCDYILYISNSYHSHDPFIFFLNRLLLLLFFFNASSIWILFTLYICWAKGKKKMKSIYIELWR